MQKLPFVSVLLSVLLLSSAEGQLASSPSGATGTVTGRIYCSDTNGPARFAQVTLEPVSDVSNAAEQAGRSHPSATRLVSSTPLTIVNNTQTGPDGSFTEGNLKPGVYYVNAELPGYLSAVPGLSTQNWVQPTAAVADQMAKSLQRVSVEEGRTAFVTLTLERGASVNGTVSFSDGAPAVGVGVKALLEKSDGNWEAALGTGYHWGFDIVTNDLGQYRIAGLRAGHYVIEVDLAISQSQSTGSPGGVSGNSSASGGYWLSIFSGGKLKANKDAAFALTAGESRPDEDLVIPKLHSVSGMLVAARDGRPLVGNVDLFDLDGKARFTSTNASQTNGGFRFEGIPEGNIVLMIYAMDPQALAANADAIAKNPGSARVYGMLQEPLDVSADVSGIVISVPQVDMPVSVLDGSVKPQ